MTRPLRIALLTHSTNPRGGVSHALSLAEALTDLGHEAVVHAPDPAGRGFFREARCGLLSVPARAVDPRDTAAMVEQRIGEYVEYFAYSPLKSFDLYHAQDGIGANALADLRARGLIPAFARTVHHLDDFANPRLAARQRRGVAVADAVLCVSETWRRRLAEQGIQASQVDNGVDPAVFSPVAQPGDAAMRQRHGLGRGPIVLSVGGLEARKNTLVLIEAFAVLRRAVAAVELVILGGASVLDHSAYALRCREAIAALGIGNSVRVTGPVAQAEMPAFYRLAAVLAFPSLNEGFGLAVIEAMASGTPVVVSAIPPFTDYLAPEDARFVDPADAAGLATALRQEIDDEAGRMRRVARGLAVARRFDWTRSARQHLAIYRSMGKIRETALA